MKQQHGKYDVKNYSKGVNSDVSKELISELPEGFHADSLNMRSLAQDGDNLGKTHIGGESGFYPAIDTRDYLNQSNPSTINFTNYSCVMTQSINGHIVEIWCSKDNLTISPNPSEPSFIRIDGNICLMSVNFPVYHDKPLQYDKNQHVLGSEFYITDFYSEPMIFNLQDLIDSYATTKYFSSFDVNQYTVALQSSLYKPQFIDLVETIPLGAIKIGNLGLPVGQYSYSYRYVSLGGDLSSLAPLSDLIPVVKKVISNNRPIFHKASISANPDITLGSSYNPYLKIRYVNDNAFASIEIIRHCWNTGETLDAKPISYIIHTEDISNVTGMAIFSFVDLQNDKQSMQNISYEESNIDVTSIIAAKSIRFYNRRLYLMNLKYKSKVTDSILNLSGDNYLFPTVQKMYHQGHSDVYNSATYKSYMRGEKQGYGVLLYDKNGSATYVSPIPTSSNNNSYQHPNRRAVLNTESKQTSYEGVVTATPENNGNANLTFEVFDHVRAESRGGLLSYDINSVNPSNSVLHPVSQNDDEFNFRRPNTEVGDGNHPESTYDPKCFNLDYYSLGVAVKNIQIPEGFSGFSIVKTEPAKRVVAQGIAMYDFSTADHCYVNFPDLNNLDTITLTELLQTGDFSSYELEIVSSLGFFSEIYSGGNLEGNPEYASHGFDMITFSRILREQGDINPTVVNGYVKYDQWKNTSSTNVTNKIFQIESITPKIFSYGSIGSLRIKLTTNIYSVNTNLHGTTPMYVVNLIKKNKDISDSFVNEYTSTGHFQKKESIIGNIKTSGYQSFPLISERWEDCINQPFENADNQFNGYALLNRYIYIRENQNDKAWINVTYKLPSEINLILTDIATNGYYQSGSEPKVYGVYKNNLFANTESLQRNYEIIFEQFNFAYSIDFFIPNIGSDIIVKYDDRIPTRVFGGDTFINECIWAFQDNKFSSVGDALETFALNRLFPYKSFRKSIGIIQYGSINVSGSVFLTDAIDYPGTVTPNTIRQLINMYTAETRSSLCFSFEDNPAILNDNSKFYPLKNYVPRPYYWDVSDPSSYVSSNYVNQYGSEWVNWYYGGFKHIQTINQDNCNRNNAKLLTSSPQLGFTEQTDYPTRIAWSDKKAVNQQNTPSTKTFLTSNFFDLSDNNGEIKFAWSGTSEQKGSNLYAVTGNGIALILVDKRVINDANAQELFSGSAVNEGVVDGLWLTQTIGMDDEYWRGWAEYNNALFFFNSTGVYALASNQIEFLSEKGGFQEIYKNRVLPYIGKSVETKMSGVFNVLTKEYIMTFDESVFAPGSSNLLPSSLIYGVTQQALQCRASYNYDKYLSIANKLYGMRGGATFRLGEGNIVDGKFMVASVTGVSTGKQGRYEPDVLYHSKEFIRIRVNSNHKPNRILFYDNYENYINGIVSSTVDSDAISYSIKDYGGYECYIPRKALAPHLRQQGRVVLFRIENDTNEDFTINATMVQFKVLK